MDEATTRELVRTASAQIPVRAPDPTHLIARAAQSRRPSRWAIGAAAAVLGVLAATALVGSLVKPHGTSPGDQRPTKPPATSSSAGPKSVAAWVRSLPQGPTPALPVLQGARLRLRE